MKIIQFWEKPHVVFPPALPTPYHVFIDSIWQFFLPQDTSGSFEETSNFVLLLPDPSPYYFVPPTKASPYYVCATLCMLIRSALDQLGQAKQMHRKQTMGKFHHHPVWVVDNRNYSLTDTFAKSCFIINSFEHCPLKHNQLREKSPANTRYPITN